MNYFGEYFWYLENAQGNLTVGITEEGLEETGDVHQVVLAQLEEELNEEEGCGTIRGKDGFLEIPAPMDIRILERNESLTDTPEMIHDDPTGESWLIKVEEI